MCTVAMPKEFSAMHSPIARIGALTMQACAHLCFLHLSAGGGFYNLFTGGGSFGEGDEGGKGRRRRGANFAPFNRVRLMLLSVGWALSVYVVSVPVHCRGSVMPGNKVLDIQS
eukprot:scaffold313436_cov21-Tisochrysis_lutea.AAC.1